MRLASFMALVLAFASPAFAQPSPIESPDPETTTLGLSLFETAKSAVEPGASPGFEVTTDCPGPTGIALPCPKHALEGATIRAIRWDEPEIWYASGPRSRLEITGQVRDGRRFLLLFHRRGQLLFSLEFHLAPHMVR